MHVGPCRAIECTDDRAVYCSFQEYTTQDRMSSFGSRRRRFSGSSSMRLASRAPLPARDTDTPWWPWTATYSFSEGTRAQVQGDRMSSFGSRRRRFSGSSSMRISSRDPLPAGETDTPWLSWAATSSFSEGTRTQVRRHAALAGHRLGSCQISHRRFLRALLLCARGCMVSSGCTVHDGTRVWW